MKKRAAFFAIIIFSLLGAAPVFAQENLSQKNSAPKKNWSFSFEPKAGARIGACKEIVWARRSFDGERYKESELVYELLPAFYAGADFSVAYKNFGINFLSKIFFAQKSGTLKDSDWANDAFCSNGDTVTKTDYSEHQLVLAELVPAIAGFDLELQTEYKFRITDFFALSPLVSFNAQCLNFTASNGTGWYGDYIKGQNRRASCADPGARVVYDFRGLNVLEYKVYNLFLWAGLRASFYPARWAAFHLASEVSPFSMLFDFDSHLTNKRDFKEIAYSNFLAFRQTVKAEFRIADNCWICQRFALIFTGQSEGSMYVKDQYDSDYNLLSNNAGGAQMSCVDIEISFKFAL